MKKNSSISIGEKKYFSKTLLSLCILSASNIAFCQEPVAAELIEEVTVTGMRQAIESAQEIKRSSATIVDSITSDDMGNFPDKSVAEALQRVSGVTVNRFAGKDDTSHFSAEPSGVLIRGLDQVRTEFNGRDSFSANASRGLSWGDVSPELLAGVDTYKNQMAELVEGGIAGTVNMRTRLPFDQDGQMIAISAAANYGDLSEKITPDASGLYSNRWLTATGEWGALINFSHSEVETRSQGNQLGRVNRFRDVYDVDVGADGQTNSPTGADSLVFIPAEVTYRDNLYDRERNGVSLAGQWKDLDDTLVVSTQFNRSKYQNSWEEHLVSFLPADLSYSQSVFYEIQPSSDGVAPASAPQPLPGKGELQFDKRGFFSSGYLTADIGWWGGDAAASAGFAQNETGGNLVNPCYDWNGCSSVYRRGIDFTTTARYNQNENMTQDFAINLKWSPRDDFRSSVDFHYVDSYVKNYDIEAGFNSFADIYLDMSGDKPFVDIMNPTNVNLSAGAYQNPSNYYFYNMMDHVEDSEGDSLALKTDFEFDVDSGYVQSVKAGLRVADRDQVVRYSDYNWHDVAASWRSFGAKFFNVNRHESAEVIDPTNESNNFTFTGYPKNTYVSRSMNQSYFGLSQRDFVFPNIEAMKNQQAWANAVSAESLGMVQDIGWDPVCSNRGNKRGSEIAGTCFTPAEVVDVSEETSAIYVQLNFGGDNLAIGDMPITGNLGVRYVETELVSAGGTIFPSFSESDLECRTLNRPEGLAEGERFVEKSVGCFLGDAQKSFASGEDSLSVATSEFSNVLPSLNVKLEITDEWLARFALSRAISRPDIGMLRNYTSISATLPNASRYDDPLWVKDTSGDIVGANVKYKAKSQNPYLKPITADQVDISLERYFSNSGSFVVNLFQKEFSDYIQSGVFNRTFTNGGSQELVEVIGPQNGEGASLYGVEVAYQTFFDFLPAPYDGLGIQTNYTRIENDGIKNVGVDNTKGDGDGGSSLAPDAVSIADLEGLSKDTANFVVMWEKDGWASRLAYSWRSEHLVTAVDCCVVYPVWSGAAGYLDGSIAYTFDGGLELSFEASNLLNQQTELFQQVENDEDGGLKLRNAWFQNDRRFTLGARMKF